MFFESLEKRRLLAVAIGSLTANEDAGGKLTVQGGTATGDNMVVIEAGAAQPGDAETEFINSLPAGSVVVRDTFNNVEQVFSGVTQVQIDGRKGNDSIVWHGKTLNATVQGGSGADAIWVDDSGTGSSKALGGNGNDNIRVIRANNSFVDAGAGDDYVEVNSIVYATEMVDNGDGTFSSLDGGALAASLANEKCTVKAGDGNDTIKLFSGASTIDGGGKVDLLLDESGGYATYSTTNVESTATLTFV
jgi:Ca2+-binding RTX toxin-like protein